MFNVEVIMILSGAMLNFCLNVLWCLTIKRIGKVRLDEGAKNPTPYLLSFIGSLWASYGLFLLIKHIEPRSVSELLVMAIGVWVCILMALTAKHYAISMLSLRQYLKDYLVDLIGIILMSLIIYQI